VFKRGTNAGFVGSPSEEMAMLKQDRPTQDAQLLTALDVAEILSISKRSVWRLTSAGEIPKPIKLGHSCRWSRKSIEQFVIDKVEGKAA